MGKIRISARLSEERVLPSECYEPLVEVLNDAVSLTKVRTPIKMNEVDCLYQTLVLTLLQHEFLRPNPLNILEQIWSTNLTELANTLVRLYLGQGLIVEYLDLVCAEEILKTSMFFTRAASTSLLI